MGVIGHRVSERGAVLHCEIAGNVFQTVTRSNNNNNVLLHSFTHCTHFVQSIWLMMVQLPTVTVMIWCSFLSLFEQKKKTFSTSILTIRHFYHKEIIFHKIVIVSSEHDGDQLAGCTCTSYHVCTRESVASSTSSWPDARRAADCHRLVSSWAEPSFVSELFARPTHTSQQGSGSKKLEILRLRNFYIYFLKRSKRLVFFVNRTNDDKILGKELLFLVNMVDRIGNQKQK